MPTNPSPMNPMENLLDGAPELPGRIQFLLGGPSSGKTSEVAARIEALAPTLEPGRRILGLASNLQGTGEIYSRLDSDRDAAGRVIVQLTTPIDMANKVMRSRGVESLGLSPGYTVWGEERMDRVLAAKAAALLDTYGVTWDVVPETRRRYWSRKAGIPCSLPDSLSAGWFSRVTRDYEKAKHAAGGLDIYDLMAMAVHILGQNNDAGDSLGLANISHVLVDDCQDLTPNEMAFVTLISQTAQSVTVTANQNSSRCRSLPEGPDMVRALRDEQGVGVSITHLRRNHRHTPGLATLASLLEHDPALTGLTGISRPPHLGDGSASIAVETANGAGEVAERVRVRCSKMLGDDPDWTDVAVLCRDSSQMDAIRMELESGGVPTTCHGDWDDSESVYVRVTGLLTCVTNPEDPEAVCAAVFGRWHPRGDVAVAHAVERVCAIAGHPRISLGEAAEELAGMFAPEDPIHLGLTSAAHAHRELVQMLQHGAATLSDLVETAIGHLDQEDPGHAGEATALLRGIAGIYSAVPGPVTSQLLALLLDDVQPGFTIRSRPDPGALTLETIPAPRRRKYFKNVCVIDTGDSEGSPAEEDRLLYEAITRATDRLVFICATGSGGNTAGLTRFGAAVARVRPNRTR